MRYNYFNEYETVEQKRKKSAKKLAEMRKKNRDINPVVIRNGKIANTWWGKAWVKNLESYSDYSNRLPRGRSYVKNGAVLDLKISRGTVNAIVQGSRSRPYKIAITIKPIGRNNWKAVCSHCAGKINSLSELLDGRFPEDMAELFTKGGKGLFPSPREIKLECSCPDWANMCKHVAAALYGIGSRMDDDPSLFFTLRGADMEDLVTKAVEVKSKSLLKKSCSSGRIIKDKNILKIFEIDED